ncbi:conjugation system SOS inhibitor PsiB family protein [Erwinia typographi]|uniref:conjugation system SOS inhibitor PsiB family protein n=1 Tax=Erwinia typographi TaxID=371042 RepID=UPI00068A9190|nr:conjugation system SOS inhibitor PsiB family protein [Erwinia typographi]
MGNDEVFTLEGFLRLSAAEFDEYRDRGDEFRQRLNSATLRWLAIPDVWNADCEFRQEWGGQWPVHLRLTHPLCAWLTVEVTSPGGENLCWLLRLCDLRGYCYVLYSQDVFRPDLLRGLLVRIDTYAQAGLTRPAEIQAAMRLSGSA